MSRGYMGKVLGSLSGMRKYLEEEMLAESLKGRIRYGCTAYVGMDGGRIFEVCIDGTQVKRFSWETVNSYFIHSGYTENKHPSGIGEYWAEFWTLLEEYPLDKRTEYTDEEFCLALERYRNGVSIPAKWSILFIRAHERMLTKFIQSVRSSAAKQKTNRNTEKEILYEITSA